MMDFIGSLFRAPPRPVKVSFDLELEGERVFLRMLRVDDWKSWRVLRDLSRDHLVPWEPSWPNNALSYGHYCSLVRRYWREWRQGQGYAFAVFSREEGERPVLVGGITLGSIQYAAAQKGTVGYWLGKPFVGQGYMTEALDLVCSFAFGKLKLQRVEASCLPHNEASKGVLQRCGFDQEGFARAYLQINGKREDHLLWGKGSPCFR